MLHSHYHGYVHEEFISMVANIGSFTPELHK